MFSIVYDVDVAYKNVSGVKSNNMGLLIKTSIVVSMLTFAILLFLKALTKRSVKGPLTQAANITAISLMLLCVGRIWIAFFGISTVASYVLRKRAYAPGLAIFLIIITPGIGLPVMIGSLQLIDFSIATCVILGLIVGQAAWKGRFKSQPILNDVPAYAIVMVLTFISARDSAFTNIVRVAVQNAVAFIVPYMLIRRSLRDVETIRNTVILIVAAGLSVSIVAIFESVKVWPIYQAYGQYYGTLVNPGVKMRGGMLRAGGPSMNPPLSSAILALCFVTAFSAADLFKSKISHRFVLLVIGIGLFAMQSRVGWLGAVIGSIGVMVSKRGIRAIVGYVPVVALLFGMVYGAAQINQRISSLVGFSSDAKGSVEYRDQLTDRGIEVIKEHILIGQPISAVEQQMANLRQGEGIIDFVNAYLAVALFSGISGLLIFIGALLIQVYNAYYIGKSAKKRGLGSIGDLGSGVIISIIIMLPFIGTDYRVILVAILLFAVSNSMLRFSHNDASIKKILLTDRGQSKDTQEAI